MKVRFKSERGIALVITLVMLAVVTVMAIVFLAVTRRERSSVKLAEETAIAKDMADAAMERAKTEAIAGMDANASKLHYDIFNSHAFSNPNGFNVSLAPTNVNVAPVQDWATIRANGDRDYLEMLGNLQHDPAVPVFVRTNQNGQGDFRYFLDFNRNGQFETNGVLAERDNADRVITTRVNNQVVTNFHRYVGDPEWIGILERPDYPHSETNRFVGRMAYLVLPSGKSLDLNFMHNQLSGSDQLDVASAQNGYSRSQGVGSWEINLAAFLRTLNTNSYAWGPNTYRFQLAGNATPTATGNAFNDARALLSFRYDRRSYLKSMYTSLGPENVFNPITTLAAFQQYRRVDNNNVQDFGLRPYISSGGEIFFPPTQAPPDVDNPDIVGWPGSVNTNGFTDLQQLFSTQIGSAGFLQRLQVPATRATANTGRSSYDRYTFYRMASQLGTDSTPALEDKIHLNFTNPVGRIDNVVVPWGGNVVEFFTNAANLMLKASIQGTVTISNRLQELTYGRSRDRAGGQYVPTTFYLIGDTLVRTNFSITNIQVEAVGRADLPFAYQNEYTPTIHRILQVAANIADNMRDVDVGNRGYPYYPTVFVPMIYKSANNSIGIAGFLETTNTALLASTRIWRSFSEVLTNAAFTPGFYTNVNFYGQHFIVGAKKGHPNFNEVAMRASVNVSRKLSATRQNPTSTNMTSTNQMFLIDMSNQWGVEAWNSYSATYPKELRVNAELISEVTLRDGTNIYDAASTVYTNTIRMSASRTITKDTWRGLRGSQVTNMVVVFDSVTPLIRELSYSKFFGNGTNRFRSSTSLNSFGPLERTPELYLHTTNRLVFSMIDPEANKIIDVVSYDRLVTEMNLGDQLVARSNPMGGTNNTDLIFWDTNIVGGLNGGFTVGHSNQMALAAGEMPLGMLEQFWKPYRYNSPDRDGAIATWRVFNGLDPRYRDPRDVQVPPVLTHQVPFTPTRTIAWTKKWQVNDPFVHYMHEDLREEEMMIAAPTPIAVGAEWNIGRLNDAYQPWGRHQRPEFAHKIGLQDPGIRGSDDWEFPVARRSTVNNPNNYFFFPNIGALGQIHRGTPWQTIYMKSIYQIDPNPPRGKPARSLIVDPSLWSRWSGSVGTYPANDWRFLDAFTTAANENAARGLLGVNQTNTAAWSAVMGGVVVARGLNVPRVASQSSGVAPEDAFEPVTIEPGSPEVNFIVQTIVDARTNQYDIINNPQARSMPNQPYMVQLRMNRLLTPAVQQSVFERMGEVLGAPGLSIQSPYLVQDAGHLRNAWTDQAVEYLPQQILSLLRRDEPRFVVYSFGQSLKPAPQSLTSDPLYYHMCTNYQITGEVITKTTFRVEGEPRNQLNPLKAIVEKYEILPPPE